MSWQPFIYTLKIYSVWEDSSISQFIRKSKRESLSLSQDDFDFLHDFDNLKTPTESSEMEGASLFSNVPLLMYILLIKYTRTH